jgi:hypothetical protein
LSPSGIPAVIPKHRSVVVVVVVVFVPHKSVVVVVSRHPPLFLPTSQNTSQFFFNLRSLKGQVAQVHDLQRVGGHLQHCLSVGLRMTALRTVTDTEMTFKTMETVTCKISNTETRAKFAILNLLCSMFPGWGERFARG